MKQILLLFLILVTPVHTAVYEVKSDMELQELQWTSLTSGDTVQIFHKAIPYRTNIVLSCSGTKSHPIVITGVPNTGGDLPTIEALVDTQPVIEIDFYQKGIEISNFRLTNGKSAIKGSFSEDITISNNFMFNNGDSVTASRENRGGGLYFSGGQSIIVQNNTIESNYAGIGGAIYSSSNGLQVTNNIIRSNFSVSDHGGALFLTDSAIVTGNTFYNNRVGHKLTYGWGGAILLAEGNFILSYNRYFQNHAMTKGGAIMVDEASHALIHHELIYNNSSAQYGAAIAVDERYDLTPSYAEIINCTVVDNHSPGEANGVILNGSFATIRNSIFWNSKGDINLGIRGDTTLAAFNTSYTLTNEICEGAGNISGNPLFYAEDDFHLQSRSGRWDNNISDWVIDTQNSPALDAGDPNDDASKEPHKSTRINLGCYGNTKEASISESTGLIDSYQLRKSADYSIKHNPLSHSLELLFPSPVHNSFEIQIYSLDGKEIVSENCSPSSGERAFTINLSTQNIASGFYLCWITQGTLRKGVLFPVLF